MSKKEQKKESLMSEIKEQVQNFIHKYLDVTDNNEAVIADYALKTWQPIQKTIKYLQFVGNHRTGKTRAGEVMAAICHKAIKLPRYTTPDTMILRISHRPSCVAIFEEIDFVAHEKRIEKILINGDSKEKFFTIINEGEVSNFSVFGYKVILSMREFQNPAVRSRCIIVRLTETNRIDISRALDGNFEKDSAEIQQALKEFFDEGRKTTNERT